MTRLAVCWLALACAACASNAPRNAPSAAASAAAQPASAGATGQAGPATAAHQPTGAEPVPSVFAGATEATAGLRLSNATALAEQARRIIPGWSAADPELAQSRAAIARRNWPLGSLHADEAQSLADAALSDHYTRSAQQELDTARGYTGLDDTELALLDQAEETLSTGNGRLAYGRLRSLNDQLAHAEKPYTVVAGDSLWIISGRPEIYANPWLWPLIWHANLAAIPRADRVGKGRVLRIPTRPTVDQVVHAVDFARGGASRKLPEIGPVREAAP